MNSDLMFAVARGYVDKVKSLLDQGADVDFVSSNTRFTTKFFACIPKTTPLISAVKQNNVKMVKLLLNHNADCHFVSENTHGAVFEACAFNALDSLKCLVEHGADINQLNDNGETPLLFLFQRYRDSASKTMADVCMLMMKLLIENGADLDIKDSIGKSFMDRINSWETAYTKELKDFIQFANAKHESKELDSIIDLNGEDQANMEF